MDLQRAYPEFGRDLRQSRQMGFRDRPCHQNPPQRLSVHFLTEMKAAAFVDYLQSSLNETLE